MRRTKTGDQKFSCGHFNITALFFIKNIASGNVTGIKIIQSDYLCDTDYDSDSKRPSVLFDSQWAILLYADEPIDKQTYKHSFLYRFNNEESHISINME